MNEYLKSSSNPNKTSLTFTGLVVMAVPLITQVLATQGVEIAQSDIITIVENVTALIGIITATFGALRKVYNNIKK